MTSYTHTLGIVAVQNVAPCRMYRIYIINSSSLHCRSGCRQKRRFCRESGDLNFNSSYCQLPGLLLARRAKLVERAWVRVAREAVGAEGQVVPQQLASRTVAGSTSLCMGRSAAGARNAATPRRVPTLALVPQPCAAAADGAALRVAERRKHAAYPEVTWGGPQTLVVLGWEVGGRWTAQARRFVRDLVRLKAYRAPPAIRAAATVAWARRWWSMLSVAVQQAVAGTALGRGWLQLLQQEAGAGPPLDGILDHAAPDGRSCLPLRP